MSVIMVLWLQSLVEVSGENNEFNLTNTFSVRTFKLRCINVS